MRAVGEGRWLGPRTLGTRILALRASSEHPPASAMASNAIVAGSAECHASSTAMSCDVRLFLQCITVNLLLRRLQGAAREAAAQAAQAAEHLEGELSKADESASAWKAAAEGVAADKAALEQAAAEAATAHSALQQSLEVHSGPSGHRTSFIYLLFGSLLFVMNMCLLKDK